uniref:Lipoprotein n=1 Tax=Ascaris lumbricoides TaxID=6252 RepID=A0A0M3HX94_ASCLU
MSHDLFQVYDATFLDAYDDLGSSRNYPQTSYKLKSVAGKMRSGSAGSLELSSFTPNEVRAKIEGTIGV